MSKSSILFVIFPCGLVRAKCMLENDAYYLHISIIKMDQRGRLHKHDKLSKSSQVINLFYLFIG